MKRKDYLKRRNRQNLQKRLKVFIHIKDILHNKILNLNLESSKLYRGYLADLVNEYQTYNLICDLLLKIKYENTSDIVLERFCQDNIKIDIDMNKLISILTDRHMYKLTSQDKTAIRNYLNNSQQTMLKAVA